MKDIVIIRKTLHSVPGITALQSRLITRLKLKVEGNLVDIYRDVGVVESPVEEDGDGEDKDDG